MIRGIAKLAALALVGGAVALALPDIKRYLQMRSM
jgi:hypothetical protein